MKTANQMEKNKRKKVKVSNRRGSKTRMCDITMVGQCVYMLYRCCDERIQVSNTKGEIKN